MENPSYDQDLEETNLVSVFTLPLGPIIKAYREPQRHYHTLTHISEMFQVYIENVGSFPTHTEAIEYAIWLHDVVYDPTKQDNEEQSVAFMRTLHPPLHLRGHHFADDVERLILSTKEHTSEKLDEQVLSDLDLSIFSAAPIRYSEYARQIHEEYSFVPLETYMPKRIEILQGFLERERMYYWLKDREELARGNMQREIDSLVRFMK